MRRSVEANLRLEDLLQRADAGAGVEDGHALRIRSLDDQIAAMCAEAMQYRPVLKACLRRAGLPV